MSNVKQLITEYAELTGRPVATLSVAEYLEFKRYSGGKIVASGGLEERIFEVAKKDDINIEETVTESSKPQSVKPATKEKKEPVSSAFMMMRSISG